MPRTPDSFPGSRRDEALVLYDDGYGIPSTKGEVRYSDGYFYFVDEYGVFNPRIHVFHHISSHLSGSDAFYVISVTAPTINEDADDGYEVGWRWINTVDGYEYVLVDSTVGSAVWKNTTLTGSGGSMVSPHASTHIGGGSDEIDGDQLDIDFIPTTYTPDTSPSQVDSSQDLTSHLAGIDGYLSTLDGYKLGIENHKILRHLIHFIDEGPAGGFASGATKEIISAGDPFPSQVIWKDSSGNKIVEKNITRNSSKVPTTIEWKMYDTDGISVLVTVTDTIGYSGIFEISRTRSIT